VVVLPEKGTGLKTRHYHLLRIEACVTTVHLVPATILTTRLLTARSLQADELSNPATPIC
jgi:hypothetical protein